MKKGSRLPAISGKELVKVFIKQRFYLHHQEGSHMILRRDNPKTIIVIPNHKTLKKGTLLKIIKKADITKEELLDSL